MKHRLRQDDASHWYLVPESLLFKFDRLIELMEDMDFFEAGTSEECYRFYEEFEQHRISSPFEIDIEVTEV